MAQQLAGGNVRFYSNIEWFRIKKKYTDVTIKCGDVDFEAHQVILASASDFFDRLLDKFGKRQRDRGILLKCMDAVIFADVLKFIYTGSITVTSANVCRLWHASRSLKLTGIQDLCVEFIEQNRMTVSATLKMYSFAFREGNEILKNRLGQDIADQFKIFARTSELVQLQYDQLKLILDKFNSYSWPTEKDEALLCTIWRWFCHNREERSVHFNELLKMIRFAGISSEVTRFIFFTIHQRQDDNDGLKRTVNIAEWDSITKMPRTAAEVSPKLLTASKKMNLYVKYPEQNTCSAKIFFIDEHEACMPSSEEFDFGPGFDWIRSIALDDHLYSLLYRRRNGGQVGSETPIFRAHVMRESQFPALQLNAPPIAFGDVSLCRGRNDNNIYAYNHTLFDQPLERTNSRCSVIFDDEELARGIYLYNADLDTWLPVPPMKVRVQDACFTSFDGLLYLIGGAGESAGSVSPWLVQTYDYRAGLWDVRTNMTRYACVGADCCVHDGTIYVCGGKFHSTIVERYETRMMKFEEMDERMDLEMEYCRLVSYNHKLWAVGGSVPGTVTDNDSLYIQNFATDVFINENDDVPNPRQPRIKRSRRCQTYVYHSPEKWVKKEILKDSKSAVIMDVIVC